MPSPASLPVLVVDDEPDILELLEITLGRMGLRSQPANSVEKAKQQIRSQTFSLCLCDMRLPDGDGLEVLQFIQQQQPELPTAIITAHGNMELAVEALRGGAFDFVAKPVDLTVLRQLVAQALKLSTSPANKLATSSKANSKANSETDSAESDAAKPLHGSSPAMQTLRAIVAKVARSQAPVHVYGESGAGKELVARQIHAQSPRSDGPFVAVNCGAIPSELMESEFFGHRKGSFTGADSDKPGLFKAANHGTLFLDEVADLPLAMQVKLLRAIQQRAVRSVGDSNETAVDVRLVSASHRSLADMVTEGKFRQDLYYRINVIDITVPALRERLADLPELIDTLLKRQAARQTNQQGGGIASITSRAITSAAVQRLMQYPFPGNVRELENILERAAALGDGDSIDAEHLQLPESSANPVATTPASAVTKAPPPAGPPAGQLASQIKNPNTAHASNEINGTVTIGGAQSLEQQLETIEKAAFTAALEQTRYNKTVAAELLGMSFRSFRYRAKKLGVE